ncbi:PhpK family radical SAM P-methyltransferase [Hahella sp. CR1]|uniref:PhpK family radical SAM P-methyltransferase n=1 Tax=Hahella sp. CR1 TaxID=2992807 RepID=UPI002442F23E|nr:PhpK family radical SAM P-methyltransferase [Hahella sp. CR1]MDG9667731.1 PhpK family radical SAM P-methyltransferase [Hahella sp. CR1]
MIDCLIVGTNMPPTPEHVEMVRSVDNHGGAWRDLRLAFVEHQGQPYTALDLINHIYDEAGQSHRQFNNLDFLWPAVTYLASFLRRRGFTVDWINLFQQEKDEMRRILRSGQVRTVAVTTTLYVSPQPMIEVIKFVREHSDAHIIVGGPYISGQAEVRNADELASLFEYLGADIYVISSEGEQALAHIISALQKGEPLDGVANLAIRDPKSLLRPFSRTLVETEYNPLEENPVDYGLFPPDQLSQFISLRTAKSCPYSCAFCGFPQRAGAYKTLAPDLVEQELDRIAALGNVDTLTFLDDTFNVPKKRFKEILRLMIRKQYGFRWNSFYRSDQGDYETIQLMREAGCEGVFLGIESGSDTMLKNMNKTARRRNFAEAIPQLQEAGISAHASLIVGFPGETEDTIRETQSLIEQSKPDFYRAQLWYCDPLTPIWKNRQEYDLEGNGFSWRHRTMNSETACDWVERLFFDIRNSTWLPQHGFEQWSTFYLQRRGYTRKQVIDYVALFNSAIKAQMADPTLKAIPAPILQRMRTLLLEKTTDDAFMANIHHRSNETVSQDALESFAF